MLEIPRSLLYNGDMCMKKIGRFLASMPFAIGLLILLAAACALCSAIPQGQTHAWYTARYGEQAAGLIKALRLDDAFRSVWFLVLAGALCLSLLSCNVTKLPALLRRVRAFRDPGTQAGSAETVEGEGDPEAVFRALRLKVPDRKETGDGKIHLFAVRGTAGFWGHWICHLGILLLIIGFVLGQMTGEEMTVATLPGETKALGKTGMQVRVEDFRAELREDGSAEQFTTEIELTGPDGSREDATISVNEPAVLHGYSFFQNSYGWGADVRVEKNGKLLQASPLCAGELLPVEDKPELVLYLQEVYPELPGYLYRLYYQGNMLGMNVLEKDETLTVDDYTIVLGEPRMYTLLAVKRDAFIPLVLAGGLLILAGLALAFYVRPVALRAMRQGSGPWRLCARCRRGGPMFHEAFLKAAAGAGFSAAVNAEDGTAATGGED